jgi:2-oxoglutarate ferredoxin oxidoreductase subunit alpha
MAVGVSPSTLKGEIEESAAGVNNFSLVVATVNGSGSQTANTSLLRAIFKMGIPVSGKNLFPSNIAGLPTWFTIRLSEEGYIARRDRAEVLVAMNRQTAAEDMATVPAGGVIIYPAEWKIQEERTDVTYYALPVQQFAKASGADAKMVPYVANMVYVGALIELLGIELAEVEAAITLHFKGKPKPIALNMGVVKAALEYTKANVTKRDPFRIERRDLTRGKVMINGNEAGALGAVFGGFTVAAWYPITPSTSLVDALADYAAELRVDKDTGTRNYAIVQAEDEIAAIGMTVGAGWAGARAMTSTSGPGISLMTEYAGLAHFAEIPTVIWDIMRMGPSTGLPTRVSQGDILTVYYLGHGDTRQVCLLPSNMQECFECGWKAFDLAERLQTPVFVLSDLDIGMNLWMSEPFAYPDQPMDRGKVLSAEDLDRLGGFARYFTRGSGHNSQAQYTERPDEWEANLERLDRKFEHARTLVPAPVVDEVQGAAIGLIAYGSTDPGIVEARAMLAARGVKTSYLRLKALPTTTAFNEFVARHPRVYVVENNFDGQMTKILQTEVPQHAGRITAITHCDGLPLTARWIAQAIVEQER